ncbi:hypothetical protein Bca52824_013490 [Brassica carinata]|uniref:Pentatricopeptide repeat-containing protein n=1 Tax=Brassica carinata TaxID=52824 RepID=A0A8X8B3X7_BRACI|nr:hypothetical protein Bca52824_013490 [Brassica carinata]
MALLPAIGIPSPAPPQQTPFVSRNNHANRNTHQLNHQSTPETTVSWTSRITLLSRNGRLAEAAKEFTAMRLAGVEPNHITFIALLSGCADSEPLGDSLHGYACKLGLDRNHVMVGTAILGIYSKRGRFRKARLVFDRIEDRNSKGLHEEALAWFREMQVSGVKPDYVAIIAALAACTNLGALSFGLWVHRYVVSF